MIKTFAPLLEKSQLKLVLIKYKNIYQQKINISALEKGRIWGKESINHVPL